MLLIQWWRYYEEIKGLRKTSKKEKRKLGRRKKKTSLVKIFDEVIIISVGKLYLNRKQVYLKLIRYF